MGESSRVSTRLVGNNEKGFVRLGGNVETLKPRSKFHSCFISYSSVDTEFAAFAARLHDDLQRTGVRNWFAPEDMKTGDPVRSTAEAAIRSTEKLVFNTVSIIHR